MVGQRRRRWPTIKPAYDYGVVYAGIFHSTVAVCLLVLQMVLQAALFSSVMHPIAYTECNWVQI